MKQINKSGDVINSLPIISFCKFPPDKNWLFNSILSVLTLKSDIIFFACSLILFSLIKPFLKKFDDLKLFKATFSKIFICGIAACSSLSSGENAIKYSLLS